MKPRKKYETAEDLRREEKIAVLCSNSWGMKMGKLPISYHLDFVAFNDERGARAFIEIKNLNIQFGQYENVMLSLLKWEKGISLATSVGCSFIFVIGTTNGVYYYKYNPSNIVKVVFGGRTVNTRDDADIEPVVMIPSSYFKLLGML